MWRVLILLVALVLAAPGFGWAICQWAIDPGATGDVISAMNQGPVGDDVTFQIFDNAGVQQGMSVPSGAIASFGRYETTVRAIYATAGVSSSLIKTTYILATEGVGKEIILQVKTGGGTFQPEHFDSDFAGACDQR
ncbi:MAG: hypothetical protein C5B48_04690 [Candidatus Rokuibacteriota bacterium]|nr:MAG: hypothetical protein C5B48_04690 [Candidatus Rokubacteria bacterium]